MGIRELSSSFYSGGNERDFDHDGQFATERRDLRRKRNAKAKTKATTSGRLPRRTLPSVKVSLRMFFATMVKAALLTGGKEVADAFFYTGPGIPHSPGCAARAPVPKITRPLKLILQTYKRPPESHPQQDQQASSSTSTILWTCRMHTGRALLCC